MCLCHLHLKAFMLQILHPAIRAKEGLKAACLGPRVFQNARIRSIEWLRAIACLLVVIFHAQLQVWRLSDGKFAQGLSFTAAGTDLLLVISGFFLVYNTRMKNTTPIGVIKSRLVRVVPLYWLLTTVALIFFLLAPHLFRSSEFSLAHVAASYAFLPYPHPVNGLYMPFLVPGWTLNYLIPIVLMFSALLAVSRTYAGWMSVVPIVAIVILRMEGVSSSSVLSFYSHPVVLDFAAGMIVAECFLGRFAGRPAIVIAGAVGIALYFLGAMRDVGSGTERSMYWGAAGACLLFAVIEFEHMFGWIDLPIVRAIGDASYSIYLSSLFSLALVGSALRELHCYNLVGVPGAFAIFIACTMACGVLIYRIAEVPLSRSASRLLQMSKRDSRRTSRVLSDPLARPQAHEFVRLEFPGGN